VLARVSTWTFLGVVAIALWPAFALAPALGGCRALEPANRPIDACVEKCAVRASRQCSEAECRRGCEFILDRLVEREGENVIACVARRARRCTDVVWADCATYIGVHADGGPPPPPPPYEEE
jgi:hypothetical protein